MSFKILIAAPQSFADDQLMREKIAYYTSQRSNWELHTITRKGVVKMIKSMHNKVVITACDFIGWGKESVQVAYDKIIEHADAAIIFWDGEAYNEKLLIDKCIKRPLKHVVVPYQSVKQKIEQAEREQPVKVKRKKVTVKMSDYTKRRYFDAHLKWFKRETPQAYLNGFYSKPKILPFDSGSRIDTFIVNFLVWEGWSATKVSVLMKSGGKFIRTGAKPGTFDLTATVNGKSLKIETKHSTDTPSPEQLRMQERERRSGAIAEFIYDVMFEEFFVLYDKIVKG